MDPNLKQSCVIFITIMEWAWISLKWTGKLKDRIQLNSTAFNIYTIYVFIVTVINERGNFNHHFWIPVSFIEVQMDWTQHVQMTSYTLQEEKSWERREARMVYAQIIIG